MAVITVANQKGGVGKTTLAYNLVHTLAEHGRRVLAVDNDPQGNLTEIFLADGRDMAPGADVAGFYKGRQVQPQEIAPGIDLIGADIGLATLEEGFEMVFRLREGLADLSRSYDYIVIDALPSLGPLQVASLAAATYLLIPSKPARWSARGLTDLLEAVEKVRRRINPEIRVLGVLLNLLDTKKLSIERALEEALREQYKDMIFKSRLCKRAAMDEATALGLPITKYPGAGPALVEWEAAFEEIMGGMEK